MFEKRGCIHTMGLLWCPKLLLCLENPEALKGQKNRGKPLKHLKPESPLSPRRLLQAPSLPLPALPLEARFKLGLAERKMMVQGVSGLWGFLGSLGLLGFTGFTGCTV